MKIVRIGEPQTIISNPMSKHNYFGWPTAARLKNGKIAVVASGFRLKHVCPFGKTIISFSENDGESYSFPTAVVDTSLDDRDGGILPFGESSVLVTSINDAIKYMRDSLSYAWLGTDYHDYIKSYLDTLTEEDEKKYYGSSFRVSHDNGATFGPLYKAPITSPHGPCLLSDGSIVWVGRIQTNDESVPVCDCVCAYKLNTETGESTYLGKIDDIYYEGEKLISCEPHAIELNDGSILCHIRAQGVATPERRRTFTIFQSISKDGGVSWSKPEMILGREGGAPPHIFRHSSGALISTYARRIRPYGILAMISLDEGKTWSTEHEIYIGGESDDLGYPSCVEMPDGSLITVFYARHTKQVPAEIYQQRWKLEY